MIDLVQAVRIILLMLVVWGSVAVVLLYGILPVMFRLYLLAPAGIMANYAVFLLQRLNNAPAIPIPILNLWSYFLHGMTLVIVCSTLTVAYLDLKRNGGGRLMKYFEILEKENGHV
jgi:hypothetical protein